MNRVIKKDATHIEFEYGSLQDGGHFGLIDADRVNRFKIVNRTQQDILIYIYTLPDYLGEVVYPFSEPVVVQELKRWLLAVMESKCL